MQIFGSLQGVWIGLYENVTDWRWSVSDSPFYDTQFRNWNSGQPDAYGKTGVGVWMDTSGKWFDTSSDEQLKSVCSEVSGGARN